MRHDREEAVMSGWKLSTIAAGVALVLATTGCGDAGAPGTGDETSTTPQTELTTLPPASTTDPPAPTTTRPSDTTAVIVEPGCSATGEELPASVELPQPVAETRTGILEAAVTCDFDRLASLAGEDFTYSFGGGDDPAAYWSDAERAGDDLLAILVQVLGMSHGELDTALPSGEETRLYYWPSAFGADPTEEQWKEVAALYTAEEIAAMKDFGGYVGYRVGITASGEWLFFVAGD
jgi:hypothetical protein